MRNLVLAIGLIGALAAPAEAAKLKVGRGKQFSTIGEAVAAASEGDTIVVSRGRYTETVVVTTPGLTLKATKGVKWLPELWNGGCLTLTPEATGATVTGFTFSTSRIAVTVNAADVTIGKSRFRGGDAIRGTGATSLIVSRCDIRWGGRAVDVDGDSVTLDRSRFAHHSSGPVDIVGDDTVISKCTLMGSSDDAGFDLRGDRIRVEDCRTRSTWNHGVFIRGNDCVVRGNDIDGLINDPGIEVIGDGALVEGNVCSGSSRYSGIDVTGLGFTVRGNRIFDVADGRAGITVSNGAGGGATALVEDNLVVGSGWNGIDVSGVAISVVRNRVEDCAGNGYLVSGERHRLDRNIAVGTGLSGFTVIAIDVTLMDCEARECEIDGFRIPGEGGVVDSGEGVVLDGCRASDSAADGLHVGRGRIVTIRGCTFAGNRQDVATEIETTLDDAGGNTYDTGGPESPPVDPRNG